MPKSSLLVNSSDAGGDDTDKEDEKKDEVQKIKKEIKALREARALMNKVLEEMTITNPTSGGSHKVEEDIAKVDKKIEELKKKECQGPECNQANDPKDAAPATGG